MNYNITQILFVLRDNFPILRSTNFPDTLLIMSERRDHPIKQFKVRDLRQKEKFVINDAYLDRYARILGVIASSVYMSLCRHAGRNQECFPAQGLIAREHNISPRSVKRAIQRLKEANMILIRRERLGHGRWRNNVYVLLDRAQWRPPGVSRVPSTTRGQKRQRPGDNNDRTRGHQSPTKETHKKDTHIKDIGGIDIYSLNENGEWMGRGNMRSQIDKITLDDKNITHGDASNKFEEQKQGNMKRQLAKVKAELSERLGWDKKDER